MKKQTRFSIIQEKINNKPAHERYKLLILKFLIIELIILGAYFSMSAYYSMPLEKNPFLHAVDVTIDQAEEFREKSGKFGSKHTNILLVCGEEDYYLTEEYAKMVDCNKLIAKDVKLYYKKSLIQYRIVYGITSGETDILSLAETGPMIYNNMMVLYKFLLVILSLIWFIICDTQAENCGHMSIFISAFEGLALMYLIIKGDDTTSFRKQMQKERDVIKNADELEEQLRINRKINKNNKKVQKKKQRQKKRKRKLKK